MWHRKLQFEAILRRRRRLPLLQQRPPPRSTTPRLHAPHFSDNSQGVAQSKDDEDDYAVGLRTITRKKKDADEGTKGSKREALNSNLFV
jgi:hypothetical protein